MHSHADFEASIAALRSQFRCLGETGAYYFLYVVGVSVPPHEECVKNHDFGRAKRARTT